MGRPTLMILGTYHMSNPNADAVNFSADDVLSPKRQSEIRQLVNDLEQYGATKIAVEVPTDQDSAYRDQFRSYLHGTYELDRSEVDQVGFRLAKSLGHPQVYPVDWFDPPVAEFDTNFEAFAAKHDQSALLAEAYQVALDLTNRVQEAQSEMTVSDLLMAWNDLDNLLEIHRVYFKIARIGADVNYPGANWVQKWFGRNLKIFANVTRLVESDEERIMLIIGAGHVWPLRQYFEEDGYFDLVDPMKYLSRSKST